MLNDAAIPLCLKKESHAVSGSGAVRQVDFRLHLLPIGWPEHLVAMHDDCVPQHQLANRHGQLSGAGERALGFTRRFAHRTKGEMAVGLWYGRHVWAIK